MNRGEIERWARKESARLYSKRKYLSRSQLPQNTSQLNNFDAHSFIQGALAAWDELNKHVAIQDNPTPAKGR